MIVKKCGCCKGTGKYGRLKSEKAKPIECWICHGMGRVFYPETQDNIDWEEKLERLRI